MFHFIRMEHKIKRHLFWSLNNYNSGSSSLSKWQESYRISLLKQLMSSSLWGILTINSTYIYWVLTTSQYNSRHWRRDTDGPFTELAFQLGENSHWPNKPIGWGINMYQINKWQGKCKHNARITFGWYGDQWQSSQGRAFWG